MPAGIYEHKVRPLEPKLWSKIDKNGPTPKYHSELGPCWIWTGARNNKGGANIRINHKSFLAYRVIYELMVGPIPDGKEIDHICCNGHLGCVNPSHLRVATQRENSRNKRYVKNSSGFKGVRRRGNGRWQARISDGEKTINLGFYDTPEEAHESYCAKATELFGAFVNFG
jgi:hypothetical protein